MLSDHLFVDIATTETCFNNVLYVLEFVRSVKTQGRDIGFYQEVPAMSQRRRDVGHRSIRTRIRARLQRRDDVETDAVDG